MSNDKVKYINKKIAFDIETSSYMDNGEKRAIVYAYTIAVEDEISIYRTFNDFRKKLDELINTYDVNLKNRLVIYVHNLSYEWAFIKHYFQWFDAFAIDSEHKVIRATTTEGIEFRCSYILTNKSLAAVGKDVGVSKMVGDIDHNELRNSITPLTEEEIGYIENDVLIIIKMLEEKLQEDDFSTIPLTKTGYVRRRMRRNTIAVKDSWYKDFIFNLKMTDEDYKMARNSFQGGYTHANAKYTDKTLGKTLAYDKASAYPEAMIAGTYPVGNFKDYYGEDIDLSNTRYIAEVEAKNFNAAYPFPTLSESRATVLEGEVVDNGRVYSATKARFTVTDVDLDLFRRAYDVESIQLLRLKYAPKALLPKDLIDPIITMYRDKDELKGVKGEEVNYRASKEDLNSVFGSTATDPVRTNLEFDIGNQDFLVDFQTLEEQVLNHNFNSGRYLFYPWASWITAYSRSSLLNTIFDLIDAGVEVYYCDTDSIYMGANENIENVLTEVNKNIEDRIKLVSETRGEDLIDIGKFDFDGEYDHFKTLGAKRYMTEKDGVIDITVSGLSKNAAKYIQEKGGFDFFTDGMKVPKEHSGRMIHAYSDETAHNLVTDYLGNTVEMKQKGFIHLEQSEYRMTISETYKDFLGGIRY